MTYKYYLVALLPDGNRSHLGPGATPGIFSIVDEDGDFHNPVGTLGTDDPDDSQVDIPGCVPWTHWWLTRGGDCTWSEYERLRPIRIGPRARRRRTSRG